MHKWTVRDRQGREIYLTEERWQHIISRHKPLAEHLDDVLATDSPGSPPTRLIATLQILLSSSLLRRCPVTTTALLW